MYTVLYRRSDWAEGDYDSYDTVETEQQATRLVAALEAELGVEAWYVKGY